MKRLLPLVLLTALLAGCVVGFSEHYDRDHYYGPDRGGYHYDGDRSYGDRDRA
jgi:hypothetical protein